MTIWSCKALTAALALTALAACEGGTGGSFLNGLNLGAKDVALSQTSMAFGAVTLKSPRGFCIDKRSLRQDFALMARCDTLGVPSAAKDAPLGIITASFVTAAEGSTLPTPSETAATLDLVEIIDPVEAPDNVIFRASSDKALHGSSPVHWRGTARIGDQIVGLALHGPEGGRAISSEGRAILSAVIAASFAGS